jgi:hypothetical protein
MQFFKNHKFMIQKIKQFAIKNSIYFSRTTSIDKLSHFFQLIKPIRSDKELIRLGGETDSGYLIPNDLVGIKNCFSPGVSIEAFFENDLSKLGIKSYMADYSVNSAPLNNENFDFIKKFIGFENELNYISLTNWIKSKENADNEMILQMDIEGGEYNVLIETPMEMLSRFRIIIIEFHKFDLIFNSNSFDLISSGIYKLLTEFQIVHIHPNNCSKIVKYKDFEIPPVIEFTFLRKNRIKNFTYETQFPNKLDRKNVQNNDEIILPKCFYS